MSASADPRDNAVHTWLVFFHVLSAFAFILAHGGAAAVTVVLRRQTDIDRIRTLLELSESTHRATYLTLIATLGTGIVVGFSGGWWGEAWIWTSLGIFVLVSVVMTFLGAYYFNQVRWAVGLPVVYGGKRRDAREGGPASPEEIAAVLDSWRPMAVTLIGVIGLALIVWLMVNKPF